MMTTTARADMPLPYTGRTYTIEDGRWSGGPALRSFLRIAEDWGLDADQHAAVLGVHQGDLDRWLSQAENGDFPELPDEVLATLTHILVLRRELTTMTGPEGQAAWLRCPYDDVLFRPAGGTSWGSWYAPERPVENTPLETMLNGGVRWVREVFHPRDPLAAYICPDWEMLASEDHDWLPEPSAGAQISGAALRSCERVMNIWGVELRHPKLTLAKHYGHVEIDDETLARISHVLHAHRMIRELLGSDADPWAGPRAWMREPHPEILGDERPPVRMLSVCRQPALKIRRALARHLGDERDIADEPDCAILSDEGAEWLNKY